MIESWSGVSGGPDSICLVDILNNIKNDKEIDLNFDIIVAHVNHMIRIDAKSDEEFVKKYCMEKSIPFFAKQIDVKKHANEQKIGIEEARKKCKIWIFWGDFKKPKVYKNCDSSQ